MDTKVTLGENVSEFSFKLFKKLSNSQNLIFSPASIYLALSMVAIGSSELTQQQFKQLLSFENHQELATNTSQLLASLNKTGNGITTQIANKIYEGLPQLGAEFEQIMKKNFGSAVEKVDFVAQFEQTRLQINDWVLQTTNQKIKDLLPQGSLDALTRMVLVNAIYFKGDWVSKFDSKATTKAPFHLEYQENGQKVQVDMMKREEKYDYFETGDYKYVLLPYKGNEYGLEVILPSKPLADFEKYFNHKVVLQGRNNKYSTKIKLQLPKFKIQPEQTVALKQILSELGIPDAFADSANFSFMDPNNSIKVSNVYHKAMIEVNEEGAEAAAATAAVMMLRCMPAPAPEVVFNKPFIYSITHLPTSTILFLGKVTNPTKN